MSVGPGARRALELLLRIAAFALLAWALWTALGRRDDTRGDTLRLSLAPQRLAALTRDPRLGTLHVTADGTPDARSLAWLAALRRAGVGVDWTGDLPAVAASLEPIPDPRGGVRLSIAASDGVRLTARDGGGVLDTLIARGGGASLALPLAAGEPSVAVGSFVAVPAPAESLALRSVLVVGAAGWEGKFAVAALEERGWKVAARLAVAPGATVVQGATPLDTTRYAAVVVLDTTVGAMAGDVARFVRQGGGAVVAGDAARVPALAAITPGVPGDRVASGAFLVADSVGPATLGFRPVTRLKPSAVVVARRNGSVSVAAIRVGAGRVIQAGLDESWRWRMEGGEGSVAAHRAWWASLVAAVAYAPAVPLRTPDVAASLRPVDAPRARLVDALGAPTGPPPAPRAPARALTPLVAALALLLLLLEWGSRRLRGAP